MTLCANRNPLTGNCLPNTTVLPNTFYAANGTFLRFQAPGALSANDQSLLIERVCLNDLVGNCGLPVWVYVHSCNQTACGAADAFASPLLYESSTRVYQTLAAVQFPSCYGAGVPGAADCLYSVGIFADCSQVPAGAPCTDALVRVTWAGDTAPQMLSPDCTSDQSFCSLPPIDIGAAASGVRRYASFVSQQPQPPSINIAVSACTGAVDGYLCTNNKAFTKCNPADQPSASNNDFSAGTTSRFGNSGSFTLNFVPTVFTSFEQQPFYWGEGKRSQIDEEKTRGLLSQTRPAPPSVRARSGLSADAAGGVANPTYSMLLSASNAQLISLPTGTRSVVVTISTGFALVQWNAVQWSNGAGQQPSNVEYDIFIWPATNPAPAYNLAAPCGIDAFNAASPGVVYVVVDSLQKNITGLDPAVTYTVALKATCPAGVCMPANLPSMSIAYIPATVPGLITATPTQAPTPSISRSSSPSFSASPSPSPSTSPSSTSSPSPPQAPSTQASIGSAAAAAIAVSVVGVFLAGGAAFVCWWRRRVNWRSVGTKLQARGRADAQYRQLGDGKQSAPPGSAA